MPDIVRIRDAVFAGTQSLLTILKMPFFWRPPSTINPQGDKDLVILGNGPSLSDFIVNQRQFLADKETLAVNMFVQSDFFEQIRPQYYVVSSPEMWLDDVLPEYKSWRRDFFNALTLKTQWDMDFFIPVGARRKKFWQKILANNPHIKIRFYNTLPVEGYRWFRHLLYNRHIGIPRPHNVLIPSLMLSIWMGKRKIYLAGADHNWMKELFVADDNTVYLTQKHFYDARTARPDTMKKLGKGQRKMHEILEKWYYAFRSYHDIRDYAETKGIRIINITPDSFIDAFERKKL